MKLKYPFTGSHAIVPIKRKAGSRYCITEANADYVLKVLNEEGFERIVDTDGFTIEAKESKFRVKPEMFDTEETSKKPKRNKEMTIPKGEPVIDEVTDGESV